MLKRDYLIKQLEEFGKVLALIIGFKNKQEPDEMERLINEAVSKFTNTEIEFVEELNTEQIVQLLTDKEKLNDEQLKIIADLLFEKAAYYQLLNPVKEQEAINCYKKALHIYLFLKNNATLAYSLDTHYKIEIIEKMGL